MNGMQGKATYDVLHERNRQVNEEGYSINHDDQHTNGELALGSAAYAIASTGELNFDHARTVWPFDQHDFKPQGDRRDLIKSEAMGLAEIERLDRLNLKRTGEQMFGA